MNHPGTASRTEYIPLKFLNYTWWDLYKLKILYITSPPHSQISIKNQKLNNNSRQDTIYRVIIKPM